MPSLSPETFRKLRRGRLGEPYLYVRHCPSTHELLREAGLPEGAVAAAEHQTSGRGRLGRTWEDTAGRALLCSVLLRPTGGALPQLSLVVGLATAEAIEDATGRETLVKWPNDILIDGRKVAGVLLEAVEGAVIAGIGVNVNQEVDELPAEARQPAGSLRTATGQEHDRARLLAELLLRLEQAYDRWRASGLDALAVDLEARNFLRDRAVLVDGRPGLAGGITHEGGLEATLRSGETVVVTSGEVELDEIGRGVDVDEKPLVDL
jgi:BirA family biotin operon repressor/biotin-[acetyl-CoA-carboxylase] ligase